jgi:hypothetical protein
VAEWMPIESAPRDGRRILGWNKIDGMSVFEPYQYGANGRFDGWRAAFDSFAIADFPTHWMPLPEPPKEAP